MSTLIQLFKPVGPTTEVAALGQLGTPSCGWGWRRVGQVLVECPVCIFVRVLMVLAICVEPRGVLFGLPVPS